jgi:Putative peptidoglycan binding domain
MKTKRILFLIGVVALSLTGTVASAATRASPMMTRSSATRPAPRFAPRTMTGTHRFFNDRFHRFHNQNTFVFVDTFGFPFFYPFAYPYPYPYYGYYGGYDGYGYGNASTVIEVQRRLARAGYYHGRIDGIMGPQTRRAIRAYERDHTMPAYGVIDRQLMTTMALG